jgi:hypothetical protein
MSTFYFYQGNIPGRYINLYNEGRKDSMATRGGILVVKIKVGATIHVTAQILRTSGGPV